MATENVSYGWQGKIARVNLTTGEITTQSTDPYKYFLGGMGLANKIMYDEVPEGTDPFSPESKVVMAVGPLTASGTPLAGRTTFSHLSTFTTDHLVVDSHCGGMIGAKLKLAGWDALIIEGASDKPVYIKILNDKITIEDASFVWGMGTRATTEGICRKDGNKFAVAAIGPAGENLVPYACVINSRNHSAGAGLGSILGSKKCKAIAIEGDGSVNVADPKAIAELSDYMISDIVGSNNNHVVPSTQQEWAEYYDKGSRWTARKGLYWAQAEGGAIETGEPKPGELNTVGYRCMKSTKDDGPDAEKYTIKMNGCHSCPLHCYSDMRIPGSAEHGGFEITGNTCVPNFPYLYMIPILKDQAGGVVNNSEDGVIWNQVIGSTVDDLGLWCNYGQLQRDMIVMYQDGYWKKLLSKEEYDSLPWKKIDDVDASAMQDFLPRIAYRKGEFGKWLGETTPVMLDHFGIPLKTWSDDHRTLYWSNGHPKHHTNEDDGQLGCVLNCMWNRDPMAHAHVNFTRSGLPIKEMKHIAKVTWGDESAVDQIGDYTPTNAYKMKRLQWVIARTELHNMLGLCSWMAPWEYCPDEKNQYVGDPNMEAKIFSAVTGVNKTGDDLDKDGIRAWMLQRVYTMRQLSSSNMRKDHDLVPGWIYTDPKDRKPFTKGTVRMDPDDINKSFDIFFEQIGCDKETGVPTTDTLKAYRLDFVIPVLQKEGLIK